MASFETYIPRLKTPFFNVSINISLTFLQSVRWSIPSPLSFSLHTIPTLRKLLIPPYTLTFEKCWLNIHNFITSVDNKETSYINTTLTPTSVHNFILSTSRLFCASGASTCADPCPTLNDQTKVDTCRKLSPSNKNGHGFDCLDTQAPFNLRGCLLYTALTPEGNSILQGRCIDQ